MGNLALLLTLKYFVFKYEDCYKVGEMPYQVEEVSFDSLIKDWMFAFFKSEISVEFVTIILDSFMKILCACVKYNLLLR